MLIQDTKKEDKEGQEWDQGGAMEVGSPIKAESRDKYKSTRWLRG